jgi:hypothetical protein
MSLTTRVGLLAGASAITLTGVSFAGTPQEDYEARIAELEAKVAELSGDNWMSEERAEEIRSVVHDVLADADTRSSLLNSGLQAGYDNGFMLGSPDGNFSLKLNGQLQVRYVYNLQDDAPGIDTNRQGFENTRTRLIFSGNVGSPDWEYYINAGFDRNGGSFGLWDAWIGYNMGNGISVRVGQFKAPTNREWLVDSMNQMAIERSEVSYFFGGGRTQGLWVTGTTDQFRWHASYNDGASDSLGTQASDSAPFVGANNGWEIEDTEYSFTGRFEFLFSGNWEQFNSMSSPQGSENGIMAGVSAHYQSGGEFGTALVTDQAQILILNADVSFMFDGWNLYGGFSYADTQDAEPAGLAAGSPLGFVVQGGYFFTEKLEAYARYEYLDYDAQGVKETNIITFGLNNYYSPNVKASFDVMYATDSLQSPAGLTPFNNIVGLQADTAENDGQLAFRGQLQLTF